MHQEGGSVSLEKRKTSQHGIPGPSPTFTSKNLFETLAGTVVESIEPAVVGYAPTNEQREAHCVATEKFGNLKKQFRV